MKSVTECLSTSYFHYFKSQSCTSCLTNGLDSLFVPLQSSVHIPSIYQIHSFHRKKGSEIPCSHDLRTHMLPSHLSILNQLNDVVADVGKNKPTKRYHQ